jgi:low temperature requirement protein LtrA
LLKRSAALSNGDEVSTRVAPTDIRVSSVELFFDLVFVFAITQLTTLLAQDPTIIGLLRIVLIFGNIWWMYGGYAWLTNAVPPREPALRLLILVGMAGFLIVALAIPHAFGDSGVVFGLGYLVVTVVHTGMFLRTSEESALRALGRLGPGSRTARCGGPCGLQVLCCTGSPHTSFRCLGFQSAQLILSSATV